jgi:hypothetical protein
MEAKVETQPVIQVQAPVPTLDETSAPAAEEHFIKMAGHDVSVFYGEK